MPLPRRFCAFLRLHTGNACFIAAVILLSFAPAAAQTVGVTSDPPQLAFGDVQLGIRSTLPVVLTNTGDSTVVITHGHSHGKGFFVSEVNLPITLDPGQTYTLNVNFAPQSEGIVFGEILAWSSSGPVVTIPLNGNGTLSGYSVALTWDTSPTSNVVGYNIYRATKSGGPFTKINSALNPSTSYVDYTVLVGQNNYYVTTSVNSAGEESKYSNQTQVLIPN